MDSNETLKDLGFEVLGTIGKGGYGQVRMATSKRYNKPVAIKEMNYNEGSFEFTFKFLPRELEILRVVRHPHIVELHEIVEMPSGEVYIIMEAAAMTLRKKIKELHHIPTQQAKIWFSQLLSAVSYLHQQDIVHRDLKCSNILLSADNQIKLTDFGFGRIYRGFPDLSETFCCTRSYAAPEVISKEPYNPKKSDVWSLGVVLYVMVFGCRPFSPKNKAMLPHTQVQPLRFPEGITVEEPCKSLISYMLEYDPSARPSVAEVEQHPWLRSSQERVIERSVEAEVESERSHSEGDIIELQDGEHSSAGASPHCSSVESVGEEPGCFRWSSVTAAIKRAAKAYVEAPVLRASRLFQRGMRRIFRRNNKVRNFSSASAASTEAPACSSSKKRPEDGTEAAKTQPTVRERTRRLRFPKLKVLKKI